MSSIELRDELRAVAPLWHPDLNDGIVIVLAPVVAAVRPPPSRGRTSRSTLGQARRRVSTTGRSSPCTCGPNASSRSAPRIAAWRSLTASKTSSGSVTTTTPTSGVPATPPPPPSTNSSPTAPTPPSTPHETTPPHDCLRQRSVKRTTRRPCSGGLVCKVLQARFHRRSVSFVALPGSPFAYWAGASLSAVFGEDRGSSERGRTAGQGLTTTDDFRFVRLWWEVSIIECEEYLVSICQGRGLRPFYADLATCRQWLGLGEAEMNALTGIPFGGAGAPIAQPGLLLPTWRDLAAQKPARTLGSCCGEAAASLATRARASSYPTMTAKPWCHLGGHQQFGISRACRAADGVRRPTR